MKRVILKFAALRKNGLMLPFKITPAFVAGICLVLPWLAGALLLYRRDWDQSSPRRKGLDQLISGRPIDAERHFRVSLSKADNDSDRVRSLVCLGDALMDQGRYQESKACLLSAIERGDSTGSGQASMADLVLISGTDPNQALDLADQAAELSIAGSNRSLFDQSVTKNQPLAAYMECRRKLRARLFQAEMAARKARALVQLDRQGDARQAVMGARQMAEAAQTELQRNELDRPFLGTSTIRRLAIGNDVSVACTHLEIGIAFLALGERRKAIEHFRITANADHVGKYRRLAEQHLEQLKFGD